MKNSWVLILASLVAIGIFWFRNFNETTAWIRINQLGYTSNGIKVAVWCGKENEQISTFSLVDSATGKIVYSYSTLENFGAYGPFENTYRLNFSFYREIDIPIS